MLNYLIFYCVIVLKKGLTNDNIKKEKNEKHYLNNNKKDDDYRQKKKTKIINLLCWLFPCCWLVVVYVNDPRPRTIRSSLEYTTRFRLTAFSGIDSVKKEANIVLGTTANNKTKNL